MARERHTVPGGGEKPEEHKKTRRKWEVNEAEQARRREHFRELGKKCRGKANKYGGPTGLLTDKQKLFVKYFVESNNGAESVRRAGFSDRKGAASATAAGLLKKPKIQFAIAEARAKLGVELEVTPTKIMQESARVAFSNIRHLFPDDPYIQGLPEWVTASVASIKRVVTTKTDKDGNETVTEATWYKLWDKNPALERFFKHFGLLEPSPGEDALSGLLKLAEVIQQGWAGQQPPAAVSET